MSNQLKPCPFCGNAEGKSPEKYGVKVWQERRFSGDRQTAKDKWVAECLNCGIYIGGASTEAEVIIFWNDRFPKVSA